MARPTWQGHLRLSLVTCPVALYKATEPKAGVSFNLINPETKSRIRMVAHDATTGEEVDRKKLVKGYQVNKNQYVLIEPEDLDALKLESTRVLEIEHFVDASEIDRIYWDEPYYLAPNSKTGTKAFAVILAAMREKEKVALGRLVLSQRERIVALEPREERMLVTTLRTHDEIRDADAATGGVRLPKAERQMLEIAEKIIEQQSASFDPSEFTDRYEKAVKELIRQKMKGKPVATQPRFTEPKVVDLMDMLRKSLDSTPGQNGRAAKAGRRPRAASKPASKTRRTRRAA